MTGEATDTPLLRSFAFATNSAGRAGLMSCQSRERRWLTGVEGWEPDRVLARRIRKKADRDLFISGPIVMRDDLAANVVIRRRKAWYEAGLDAYWRLLKRTVLAR
jgi:hypothetical protein